MYATPAKKPCPVSIRLPADILKLLEIHAANNGRSRNREIVARLIASLALEDVYTAGGGADERRTAMRRHALLPEAKRQRGSEK